MVGGYEGKGWRTTFNDISEDRVHVLLADIDLTIDGSVMKHIWLFYTIAISHHSVKSSYLFFLNQLSVCVFVCVCVSA